MTQLISAPHKSKVYRLNLDVLQRGHHKTVMTDELQEMWASLAAQDNPQTHIDPDI